MIDMSEEEKDRLFEKLAGCWADDPEDAARMELAELTFGAYNSNDYERHIKEPTHLASENQGGGNSSYAASVGSYVRKAGGSDAASVGSYGRPKKGD